MHAYQKVLNAVKKKRDIIFAKVIKAYMMVIILYGV